MENRDPVLPPDMEYVISPFAPLSVSVATTVSTTYPGLSLSLKDFAYGLMTKLGCNLKFKT